MKLLAHSFLSLRHYESTTVAIKNTWAFLNILVLRALFWAGAFAREKRWPCDTWSDWLHLWTKSFTCSTLVSSISLVRLKLKPLIVCMNMPSFLYINKTFSGQTNKHACFWNAYFLIVMVLFTVESRFFEPPRGTKIGSRNRELSNSVRLRRG